MNTKRSSKTRFFVFIAVLILFLSMNIQAAELDFIRNVKDAGVEFIIKADEVKKLAGLKISITYPDQLLTYVDSAKSTETSSFMHVVNDKNPGKLIIVMASAKGISGKNIALLSLRFTLSTTDKKMPLDMTTTQCQLMDENLNEIKCSVKQIDVDKRPIPGVQKPSAKPQD